MTCLRGFCWIDSRVERTLLSALLILVFNQERYPEIKIIPRLKIKGGGQECPPSMKSNLRSGPYLMQ